MTLTTPRLKTQLVIEDLDGDIVLRIAGFGRWLLSDEGDHFFAMGFLPEEENLMEFESSSFFWHDWFEDILYTIGIHGYSLQFEYVMYYTRDTLNIV